MTDRDLRLPSTWSNSVFDSWSYVINADLRLQSTFSNDLFDSYMQNDGWWSTYAVYLINALFLYVKFLMLIYVCRLHVISLLGRLDQTLYLTPLYNVTGDYNRVITVVEGHVTNRNIISGACALTITSRLTIWPPC